MTPRMLKGPDLPNIPGLGYVVEWAQTADPIVVAFTGALVVIVAWAFLSKLLGGRR